MVVGVPGENDGAGAVMVIRGARNGFTLTGNNGFTRAWADIPGDEIAGEHLGCDAFHRAAQRGRPSRRRGHRRGARRLDDAVMLLRGGPGAFAPDELLSATQLRLGEAVEDPQIDDDPHWPW